MGQKMKLFAYLRQHFFGSITNFILTLSIALILWIALRHFIDWAIINATWQGSSTLDCNPNGACFAMISARWHQFIYGFYPETEYWRINFAFVLLVAGIINFNFNKRAVYRFVSSLILALAILLVLKGGIFLKPVSTSLWGGLFLTLFLTIGCIIGALPLAILLALGRNSSFIVIKSCCILFIEVIRGVPLISILFMASVMLPLLLPQEIVVDKLLRAFVGMMCFQAAYLAEVLRGGLNSIPKGQYEAAGALGFSYWQKISLIILPQTFRAVIPGLVNNFIGLFKDTTLVLIIGIYDFLGIVQLATTSPQWLGTALEAYLFCAIVYWIFCFGISLYSSHLEKKLRIE
ncbi:MAG: amino acid ABC transporter permease [Proteobacteria bacterium]|nr:amino acid ABC transporter permease [Pseudomonadota bacterium]